MHLQLSQPYRIAYLNIVDTEIGFLEIELENGITGFGSANPFAQVIGETPTNTLQNLQSDYVQQFVGRNIEEFEVLIDEATKHFSHLPGTQAAIDIALHDAYGKYKKVSVVDLYGRKIISLPTSVTIGIKDKKEMLEDAKKIYMHGFRILKVKTGMHVDEDIECTKFLSAHFGNEIKIRVDANLGYTVEHLNRFIVETQNIQIELIEQPLPVGEEKKLIHFSDQMRNKFVADESLTDINSAKAFCELPKPFGVYNVKLMKAGGIRNAKKIADVASANGVQIFWGCNDESCVSISAALHLAYACRNTKYLDLDGSFDVIENLFDCGFYVKNGDMFLKDSFGIGVNKKR